MSERAYALSDGNSFYCSCERVFDVRLARVPVIVPSNKDERFLKSLKLADGLDVKGEGATIKVALDKSAAALDRLEACYVKNGSATDTNPFVAPSGKP